MNALRITLWWLAALAASVIGARMLIGPFTMAGIPVNAPLNPEGVFGLFVIALLTVWIAPAPPHILTTRQLQSPRANLLRWIALITAIALVYLPALRVYFVSDDFILIRQARDFSLAVFATPGGDGFFRPVGNLSLAITHVFAGDNPVWWHAAALALHATNSVLVALLGRRFGLGPWMAAFAGVLFASHGTHLEAAVWTGGRFDLLATMFTLASLLAFTKNLWVALACTLAALWSKESAYVLPFLLVLLGLKERREWRSVVPFFGLTLVAFLYRWSLFGGIGGYRADSGEPAFWSLKWATTAKAVLVRLWTSLFFPLNWSTDPEWWIALLAIAYMTALLWLARGGGATGGWRLLAALAVSILPPLHLLGGAADLSGGRLLYLPSVWFCLLLPAAVATRKKPHAALIAGAMLAFHFAALRHDLAFWVKASNRVRQICQGPPPAELPRSIDGVPALANGYAECVELAGR